MRGLVPGLHSPHPLGPALPSVYLGDSLLVPDAGRDDAVATGPLPAGTYVTTVAEEDLAGVPDDVPAEVRGELAGIWVLDLHGDHGGATDRTALSLMRDGDLFTTGALRFSSDLVTVWSTSCGSAEGSYRWRFDGDSLTLSCLEDTCGPRRFLLTAHRWQCRNFAMRLMAAFDDSLAPIFCTLDNVDAYVDPRLAPSDFVDWLFGWIGLSPTQTWTLRQRRDRIARAVPLALAWGTASGIKEVVSLFAGVEPGSVEVVENGAVAVSPTPGGELPGSAVPQLTVKVKVPDPSQIDVEQLRRIVKGAKPAHMRDELEVVKQ